MANMDFKYNGLRPVPKPNEKVDGVYQMSEALYKGMLIGDENNPGHHTDENILSYLRDVCKLRVTHFRVVTAG